MENFSQPAAETLQKNRIDLFIGIMLKYAGLKNQHFLECAHK
jgi:hypothetical protein